MRGANSDKIPVSLLSNPFYSTRSSVSSTIGRRCSSASVLSERRTSYQYGRRCSDVSVAESGDYNNNDNNVRRVQFSTIHELNEFEETSGDININFDDANQPIKFTEIGKYELSEQEINISEV